LVNENNGKKMLMGHMEYSNEGQTKYYFCFKRLWECRVSSCVPPKEKERIEVTEQRQKNVTVVNIRVIQT